jgi:thiol-disulfide isomerase/thioredoxin
MITVLAAFILAADNPLQTGAFGFPQQDGKVLCETPDLKLGAWNDAEHLYVQAVLTGDGDETLGLTADGRKIGDNSNLIVDVDGDGATTANVDRSYTLNPWPSLPGLRYSTLLGGGRSTGLQGDSKGRGAISYVAVEGGKKVRVDSYLIPLAEIARKPGDKVRVAFYGHSTVPELTVNSVGYAATKRYYSHSLPWKDFHDFALVDRPASLDIQRVPEGRTTIEIAVKSKLEMPKVGSEPPEVTSMAWLNWNGAEPPSLKSLRGEVVAVEFWATWCSPCVAGIPHLNEIHDKHANEGLIILAVTDQAKRDYIEQFMKTKPMRYTVGVGSEASDAYGVQGIPHAFVIGRDGKLVWHGHTADEAFGKTIVEELAKK